MPFLRFSPYREIAREIAARLAGTRRDGDPLAPWPEDVLVPSRGVADAVASQLLERNPTGIAGLQLHSLETLALRMVNSGGRMPRVVMDSERRLAMRAAANAVDHPMMESRGIAAMLERSYRDMRDSGSTLADLTSRVGRARGLRNETRTRAIVRAFREYERLVAQLGAIDPADLFAFASQGGAPPPAAPQILAGFYDVTGVQLRFIEALLAAGRISAIFIPTEEKFAQPFIRAVSEHAEVVRDPAIEIRRADDAAVSRFDTRFDELREVGRRVRDLLDSGVAPGEIGIVARSFEPYDVRLLNRLASEHGFRTTLGESMPLLAHRIGRGAAMLFRLAERGFPRVDVLELVRGGLRVRTKINSDKVDAAARRARIAGGTSTQLAHVRGRSLEIDDYLDLVAELEELTSSLDSRGLITLSSLFRIETEGDLAAAEALDQVAALFQRVSIWKLPDDTRAILDAFEQVDLPVRPLADARPVVWAGDVMRFRGRSFRHLFVVRMEDDVFPQRRIEDPLFPDSDRSELGFRQIGDGAEEERLLLQLLADATSSHLHYSFASGDGFGRVRRESRYLRKLPHLSEQESSLSSASRPHVVSQASRRQLQFIARSATNSIFDGYIGPIDAAMVARVASVSPTQLEDFGECPQKFFLKHLLGVTDIDRPERELQLNIRDKGITDHRILERFYRSTTPQEIEGAQRELPRLPEWVIERLETLVDDQFDQLQRSQPPFNPTVRTIERAATKRLLRDFLATDLADLAEKSLVPSRFEYRFGSKHRDRADHPEPFVVNTGGVAVRVEGTIDRIDVGSDPDSRFRIIDYKSGKALRHKNLGDKIDRGVRLQLALYAMAVADFFGLDPGRVSGAIKPLVVENLKIEKFEFELAEKSESLLETIGIFMRSILGGRFPAFPGEADDIGSCKYCPVNHSCRTSHDPVEAREVRRARDPRTLLSNGAE